MLRDYHDAVAGYRPSDNTCWSTTTGGVVGDDAVITVQENGVGAVRRLAEQGQEPQATWVAEGHLDELRARVAWSRAHRDLID